MTSPEAGILALTKLGTVGICIFVIRELIKLLYFAIKQKKNKPEIEAKESSREALIKTYENVKQVQLKLGNFTDPIFKGYGKLNDLSSVILAKDKGQFLVYNPNLHQSLDRLNLTMEQLLENIKDLKNTKN